MLWLRCLPAGQEPQCRSSSGSSLPRSEQVLDVSLSDEYRAQPYKHTFDTKRPRLLKFLCWLQRLTRRHFTISDRSLDGAGEMGFRDWMIGCRSPLPLGGQVKSDMAWQESAWANTAVFRKHPCLRLFFQYLCFEKSLLLWNAASFVLGAHMCSRRKLFHPYFWGSQGPAFLDSWSKGALPPHLLTLGNTHLLWFQRAHFWKR